MNRLATLYRMSRGTALGVLAAAALGMLPAATANATIVFDGTPGTGPAPATLGPYTMTTFPDDLRTNTMESSVPAPTGGNVVFSHALNHTAHGTGWASDWGHAYPAGDVYYTTGTDNANVVTLTLPLNTNAFYLYAQPNSYNTFELVATANDGTSSGPVEVTTGPAGSGTGAQYFGFYATDGSYLTTITISAPVQAFGFGMGEFGIATGQDFQLPVELSHFNASAASGTVTLDWATASEVDNAGFELQRAEGQGAFEPIASYLTHGELAGLGTSPVGRRYGFVDHVATGTARTITYRLVDVSRSGERVVHGEARVRVEAGRDNEPMPDLFAFKLGALAPNPATRTLNIAFSLSEESNVAVEIFSATGELVATPVTGTYGAGPHSTSASVESLQEGTYTVRLSNGRTTQAGKLVIVR